MIKKKDYRDFAQYKIDGVWQFNVIAFDASTSEQAGFCHVELINGKSERVPIDEKDRIIIEGRKFGRKHWNH